MRTGWPVLLCSLLLAAAPLPKDRPAATGPHTFQSSDGLRLWYRVAGREGGVPVLYLHGGPAEGSQAFARIVGPQLERQFRMVYFDQRGAGHSDKPDEAFRYSAAKIVDDIEALRARLGVRQLDLIGHSYGTVLAMEYAAAHPGHVRRMVLTGAVPDSRASTNLECGRLKAENPAAYAQAKQAANQPGDPDCIPFEGFPAGPARRDYAMRASGALPGTMTKMDEADIAEEVSTSSPARSVLSEPLFSYRFAHAAQLDMPVLLIAGDRDRMTDPAPAIAFAEKLPHAHVLRYANAGHFLFVDDAERFARDIVEFLH